MPDESKNLPVVVNKGGRPKGWGWYREEVVNEIIDRVASGEMLVTVVRQDVWGYLRQPGTFPSYSTIYDWADTDYAGHHPEFVQRFARAHMIRQQVLNETKVVIANTPQEGVEETTEWGPDGVKRKRTRKDMLGHRKLQIDAIDQYLLRTNPKKWSERLQQAAAKDDDSSGPDRLIIEGGLPDDDTPPPPPSPIEPDAPNEEQ